MPHGPLALATNRYLYGRTVVGGAHNEGHHLPNYAGRQGGCCPFILLAGRVYRRHSALLWTHSGLLGLDVYTTIRRSGVIGVRMPAGTVVSATSFTGKLTRLMVMPICH
jgi:hypothetical protein